MFFDYCTIAYDAFLNGEDDFTELDNELAKELGAKDQHVDENKKLAENQILEKEINF